MKSIEHLLFRVAGMTLVVILLTACASGPYRYESLTDFGIEQRAVTQTQGYFTVRAAVPSDTEAEQLFGIDLTERGIQAVWLEIRSDAPQRARFVPYSVDPKYFPPHEVAYMYRKKFSTEGWQDMERRFHELSLPRQIAAGQTVSGFIFTHADPGTKTFNVDILYIADTSRNELFTFFVDVPGFTPDYREIDFAALYAAGEVAEVDLDGFRQLLHDLPCCTTNAAGDAQGLPVNTVLVGPGRDVLKVLLRAGWSETSYERDEEFLAATDYLFGRPPDAIFRKNLSDSRDRNEMGVWLAPVRVDGEPVWMVQVRHALGRVFEIGDMFLGVRLDPDVDDGRNYLLQNLWYAQALEAYGWSRSSIEVPRAAPLTDFNGNAFFADGFRFVFWVSADSVALTQARDVGWDTLTGF